MRKFTAVLSLSALAGLLVTVIPGTTADAATPNAASVPPWFEEIKNDGTAWVWGSNGNGGLVGDQNGAGWGDARIITGQQGPDFYEVKDNGQLWFWEYIADPDSNIYHWYNELDGVGWQDARLLAEADADVNGPQTLIEVKDNGSLVSWVRSGSNGVLTPTVVGSGWGNARLIAAESGKDFVEVKQDGTMWEWSDTGNNGFQPVFIGSGWGNARLLAGVGDGEFLEVNTAGQLIEWNWNDRARAYLPTQIGTNWGNARLIS
jgi:hypothetical protein